MLLKLRQLGHNHIADHFENQQPSHYKLLNQDSLQPFYLQQFLLIHFLPYWQPIDQAMQLVLLVCNQMFDYQFRSEELHIVDLLQVVI